MKRIMIYLSENQTIVIMKMKIIFLIILAAPISILAQLQGQERIDSLSQVYEKQLGHKEKVATLKELFNMQLYNNQSVAKKNAHMILELSNNTGYSKGIAIGNYCMGNYFYMTNVNDSARIYYRKAIDFAEKLTDKLLLTNSLSNLAQIEDAIGNYDYSIKLKDSVSNMYLQSKSYLQYGISIGDIANTYINKGDYEKAIIGTIKALKVLDTIDREPFRKADLYRQLGKVNYYQGNYTKSIENFNLALGVYEDTADNLYKAYTMVDIGNSYVEMEEHEKALEYYQRSKAISEKFGFDDNTANALANIGMVLAKQGNYDLAIKNLLKCVEMNKTSNSYFNIISAMGEIGNAYAMKGDFNKSITYLNRTIHLADSIRSMDQLKMALRYRSKAYEIGGLFKEALDDQRQFQILSDSLFTSEKSKQIERLQISYETEKKEAEIVLQLEEIKTLNEKAKVDKLTKGLYAGGAISGLALSGLLFFGFRQRMKKNKAEREKQEEIYKKEIEYKQKELTSQTLHLVQKNTFIQELKENLENIKNSPDKFKTEFRHIVMLLKKENASDKDWEVFKTYFSEVHNDFDQKLKTLSSDVSEKEIRLAAFLRMNLTTKEIAATLNVLPDSILKSKYRLKKKLGLDKETDLNQFLNSL